MEIEVCVSSIEDVLPAVQAGATRIELCTAMEVLGITPTISNYEIARSLTDVPILAYLRPRAGGFAYSELEFQVMMKDAQRFYQAGARSFVLGILNEDDTIDTKRCKMLIDSLGNDCEFIFHKAFDYVKDLNQGAEELIELGFTRILTSAGIGSSLDNLSIFKQLIEDYGSQIEIMPGGGITQANVSELIQAVPLKSIHLSAKRMAKDHIDYIQTDVEELKNVVEIVKGSATN